MGDLQRKMDADHRTEDDHHSMTLHTEAPTSRMGGNYGPAPVTGTSGEGSVTKQRSALPVCTPILSNNQRTTVLCCDAQGGSR